MTIRIFGVREGYHNRGPPVITKVRTHSRTTLVYVEIMSGQADPTGIIGITLTLLREPIMKMRVNGREIDVPSDAYGKVNIVDVRRCANVPDNRIIIQQKPNGENFIMPRHGQICVDPYAYYMESSNSKRGYK